METATFASGCFWCNEAVFQRLRGVESVMSGYAGGSVANPTYEAVSSGKTGHAEAIQIVFDPAVIPYTTLLDVFWAAHDPTTIDQQGSDIGPQYRSMIFYHSEEQRKAAEKSKETLDTNGTYNDPIVTEIVPFDTFYKAEDYHQDFYDNNRGYGYCKLIIDPKIDKITKEFAKEIKPEG